MQGTNAPNKPDPSLAEVLTEVLTEVQQLRQEVRNSREEFQNELREAREEFRQEIRETREEFQQEVKRWDERFFQLSRDTLGFTRTVVTTAAVVAVLIPLLKDVAPLLIEVLTGGS